MGNLFKVLTLDGGGSKGVYTIGILSELEKKLGGKLCDHFELIYGTSTGGIIAALLSLGESVKVIQDRYFELIPKIMPSKNQNGRTINLKKYLHTILGTKKFDEFKTLIGIVSTNYDTETPLIFKNNLEQAFGRKDSFIEGFGATIADALECSCAAYPFFNKKHIKTDKLDATTIDGGFVGNNPTLFALIDALKSLKKESKDIRVLSLGVGHYADPPFRFETLLKNKIELIRLYNKMFSFNVSSSEIKSHLLFPEIKIVRISSILFFNRVSNLNGGSA